MIVYEWFSNTVFFSFLSMISKLDLFPILLRGINFYRWLTLMLVSQGKLQFFSFLNIIIYAQFCEKEKNHMWIVKKKGENSWICDISSVKKLTTVIDNCNEKTMRHIELSVQQKCTLFLFVIAAIHVGGLIWILVSEDLFDEIFLQLPVVSRPRRINNYIYPF